MAQVLRHLLAQRCQPVLLASLLLPVLLPLRLPVLRRCLLLSLLGLCPRHPWYTPLLPCSTGGWLQSKWLRCRRAEAHAG